jgi:hypothetical protein
MLFAIPVYQDHYNFQANKMISKKRLEDVSIVSSKNSNEEALNLTSLLKYQLYNKGLQKTTLDANV